jgi:N12 class adenine-specific DNA methylase
LQKSSESKKIYYNPIVGTWQIAEEFLSGDIRHKIKASRSVLENEEIYADPLMKKA